MSIPCCMPMTCHHHPFPPMSNPRIVEKEPSPEQHSNIVFDASVLRNQHVIPPQFVWPDEEKPRPSPEETLDLAVPVIDLGAFLSEDFTSVSRETALVGEACKKHGLFFVVNHGINPSLVARAQELMEIFFGMELSEKQRAQRKLGDHCGYASSFTGRFSSKLPWKETLSFPYSAGGDAGSRKTVEEYFLSVMGEEFGHFG